MTADEHAPRTAGPRPAGHDLRHHAPRRRAGARHRPQHAREGRDRPAARAPRRRRDRGRLPDHARPATSRRPARWPSRSTGVIVAALSRANEKDVTVAGEAVRDARAPAHPHVHRHQRHPPHLQAEDGPRAGARRRRRLGPPGSIDGGRRGVLLRGRHPLRPGLRGRGGRRRPSPRARPRSTSPTPSATRCPPSSRRFLVDLYEPVPGAARRDPVGPLPQRPGAGGRQLAGRRPGGRPPGGGLHQRHRRAGRQRQRRGARDDPAHPRRRAGRALVRHRHTRRSRAPATWSAA